MRAILQDGSVSTTPRVADAGAVCVDDNVTSVTYERTGLQFDAPSGEAFKA